MGYSGLEDKNKADNGFITLTKGNLVKLIAQYSTKAFIGLFVLTIFVCIQMFRFGGNTRYLIILVGAVLSIISFVGYSILLTRSLDGRPKQTFLQSIVILGGFIPYLYGSYLFFYEGLWHLRFLIEGFSLYILISALIFIFIGYSVVSAIYQISEFDTKLTEGSIKIKPNRNNQK